MACNPNSGHIMSEISIIDKFFDVWIQIADGEEIPCHKIVLCGASKFFKNLLEDEKLDIIDLKKYQKRVMKPLIDYIYTGKLELDGDLLEEAKKIGAKLEIVGLSKNNQPTPLPMVKQEESDIIEDTNELNRVVPTDDDKWKCLRCGKDFTQQKNAKAHLKNQHLTDKNNLKYSCVFCKQKGIDKKFAIKDYLSQHIKSKHNMSAKYLNPKASQKPIAKKSKPIKPDPDDIKNILHGEKKVNVRNLKQENIKIEQETDSKANIKKEKDEKSDNVPAKRIKLENVKKEEDHADLPKIKEEIVDLEE